METPEDDGTTWAVIKLRIERNGRVFAVSDAFLTTEEVKAVKKFVSRTLDMKNDEILSFTEPSFAMVYLCAPGRLVLLFAMELRPDWAEEDLFAISFPQVSP
jgi:hypothetical protein